MVQFGKQKLTANPQKVPRGVEGNFRGILVSSQEQDGTAKLIQLAGMAMRPGLFVSKVEDFKWSVVFSFYFYLT